jgi:hypothetical protein
VLGGFAPAHTRGGARRTGGRLVCEAAHVALDQQVDAAMALARETEMPGQQAGLVGEEGG